MYKNGVAREGVVTNPNLAEVAELMNRTWPRPCWQYTGPMLAGYQRRPGAGRALSLGYRCEGELAGYMAYMPCPVLYAGRRWRLLFASFWTALGKYALKSIPLKLHFALYRQACARNYQGLLTIGEEDSKGLRAFELVSARLELPYRTLARFGMMMGTPRLARRRLPPGEHGGRVQPYSGAWRGQCATLVARAGGRLPLARLFSVEELDFLLGAREGSRTWLWLEDGRVRGLLGGWMQCVMGNRLSQAFQVDHALLDGLDPGEQLAFLGAIFADPCWEGIEAVHVPLTGPAGEEAFRQAGFMRTRKSFQLNYLPMREAPALAPVERFYLEFY
jgi:hypothetical protein